MPGLTVIINCGPCESYIGKCIWSLRRQTFANWNAWVMVDPCADHTFERAVASRGSDQRIHIVRNSRRFYSMANLVRGIQRSRAKPEDVIVVLDGDDWFRTDRALQTIADTYSRHDCWMTYGSWTANIFDGEGRRPGCWPAYEEGITDFRSRKWLGTAVRTWKRWLFDLIDKADLVDQKGNYFRVTEDMAVMFPMLEMSGTARAKHIAEPLMIYNRQNPHACNLVMREEMFRNDAYIRQRPAYSPLPPGFTPLKGNLPDGLHRVVKREFGGARPAVELVDAFLRCPNYSRTFFERLLKIGRNGFRDAWPVRRLAILMMEHQLLRLPPGNAAEFAMVTRFLGIAGNEGEAVPPEELRRKLSRLDRVHSGIRGASTTVEALEEFIQQSRSDCRLALARYCFSPREIVERIVSQLRVTRGIPHEFEGGPDLDEGYEGIAYDDRGYEDEILHRLCSAEKVFWVAEGTGSEVNSLVEHPLKTVALAIKPPGSDLEIEIKRAGVRGEHVVDVVHRRERVEVPCSHRYHGGSAAWLLESEAEAEARLDALYSVVHGTPPPTGRIRNVCSVIGIPTARGEAHVLDYFTDPELFGPGFKTMRAAMAQCVAAFDRENREDDPLSLPGDLGLTAQFLAHVGPRQAILSGTSSFRLDGLSAYLSAEGIERYFRDGLRVRPTNTQSKRFADELLDEVLGMFAAPPVEYHTHAQYVAAVLDAPLNRARADRTFHQLMEQFGQFWGTLLAFRGYSDGESFVARNVGVKSVWEEGDWQVRLVFMDHDCLSLPSSEDRAFDPFRAAPGFTRDARHIRGNVGRNAIKGSVNHLKEIYQVNSKVSAEGENTFRAAVRHAYQRTQDSMRNDSGLRDLFRAEYLGRYFDWDELLCLCLERREGPGEWREAAEELLRSREYSPAAIRNYVKGVERSDEFLEHYAFLYESRNFALNCS